MHSGDYQDDYDRELFDRLRALRRRLAEERDVPAYVVFSDVTLRQLARESPTTTMAFRAINGVGDKKAAEYSDVFIAEIAEYQQSRA